MELKALYGNSIVTAADEFVESVRGRISWRLGSFSCCGWFDDDLDQAVPLHGIFPDIQPKLDSEHGEELKGLFGIMARDRVDELEMVWYSHDWTNELQPMGLCG